MGIIALKGVEIYGKIGVYSEEHAIGRKFIVDVELKTSLKAASQSDMVEDTLNYEVVLSAIHTQMGKKFMLMEAAARAIAEEIIDKFNNNRIERLVITIYKIKPFLAGYVDASKVEWVYPDDY